MFGDLLRKAKAIVDPSLNTIWYVEVWPDTTVLLINQTSAGNGRVADGFYKNATSPFSYSAFKPVRCKLNKEKIKLKVIFADGTVFKYRYPDYGIRQLKGSMMEIVDKLCDEVRRGEHLIATVHGISVTPQYMQRIE